MAEHGTTVDRVLKVYPGLRSYFFRGYRISSIEYFFQRLIIHGLSSLTCWYEKASVVKGHHIYKAVWMPVIGEGPHTKLEENYAEHDKVQICCCSDFGRPHSRPLTPYNTVYLLCRGSF